MTERIRATAPGRVNLIGDHTDYTGGLVLPMTIDRGMVIEGSHAEGAVVLHSADETHPARVPLDVKDPTAMTPGWARYVAGVVQQLKPTIGFHGSVISQIPNGAGLSSSAALELAVALVLGFQGSPTDLALLGQRAEHAASGVPCGIMDQLSIAAGDASGATLIDCHNLEVTPVALPFGLDVVVVYGHHRTLVGSAYADRVAECAAAESIIGPLRMALLSDANRIDNPLIQARARHVISENQRVRDFTTALAADDRATAGALMVASHASLRDDFGTSTAQMDALVQRLSKQTGVWGARMTGGGFGGCAVALTEPGVFQTNETERIWVVHPAPGARVEFV